MALINCPDCEHQVSDLAVSCPKCHRPIHAQVIEATSKKWKNKEIISVMMVVIGAVMLFFFSGISPALGAFGIFMILGGFRVCLLGMTMVNVFSILTDSIQLEGVGQLPPAVFA